MRLLPTGGRQCGAGGESRCGILQRQHVPWHGATVPRRQREQNCGLTAGDQQWPGADLAHDGISASAGSEVAGRALAGWRAGVAVTSARVGRHGNRDTGAPSRCKRKEIRANDNAFDVPAANQPSC